ncbi:DNA topoisomerase (ATP-hydrolyzing) subunit A [Candidatus Pantoea carbekii]|uniref:DNA gyrase subunit A n=1 Tax=Candidatus Pantoea carbekii TaxID=1235990 RepID=U3U9K1_9GAMM|nr:DNA topoisomerase (ATP-hydrolyzing) subunit A [Candidatus Pantoea carbekii]AKC32006.1 DNA gyrase subunit A GyrA [Candidatus Pantoea carbekii]BAO00528.1 GyrA protein [Candidatus Pantoea carbekii]
MSGLAKEITLVNIEEELKNSYLDYAMSVIVGRALPDVRDGLKPVHRRVLFAMSVLGNDWNKPYKKSARVVGDVIGKYHPHGDAAVYDTLVRMAQPFSMRYMLVDGQGNFGSIDGDSAAAMRYTEVRMAKISHELLSDLDKETVDFISNYDNSEQIPAILPTKIPNLLINGSSGIAVGMATNIPPHNLTEVINACLAYIEDENISFEELIKHIPGPDFPTAAIINGRYGIEDAYRTGRGKIHIRARSEVKNDVKTGRQSIVIHEIPYQVNKARLVEKIAELVKQRKLEGISALRDESDKDGMRIVIELKRNVVSDVVLNNLYSLTQLQVSFGINMLALHQGQPKIMTLKDIIKSFINHRCEVVTRRTVFELRKARERAHVLEGLIIALTNIDSIIELIRRSPTLAKAKVELISQTWKSTSLLKMFDYSNNNLFSSIYSKSTFNKFDNTYHLTEQQIEAVLDLRLQKLTSLENEKLLIEYKEVINQILKLISILKSTDCLMAVIRTELEKIRDQFGDKRRTEITVNSAELNVEDLINQEDVIVTLSYHGYVKYQPLSDYEAQRRGGKGKSAARIKEEDIIDCLLVANTHDSILCFSSRGRLYWMKVYQLPEASRSARGRPIVNLLPLDVNERITAILPVREYTKGFNILMSTAKGTVKKTALQEFSRPRSTGIIAINLHKNDELIGVALTNGSDEVMLFSAAGKVVRFSEATVRATGRLASGVRGIKLAENDKVVSLIVPRAEGAILTVTQNGYGKRTINKAYPLKSRATQGVISIKVTKRNGPVVGAVQVVDNDQIMMITNTGTLVRTRVSEVSIVGRNTQGVILIRTAENENVVGLQRVVEPLKDQEFKNINDHVIESPEISKFELNNSH